MAGNNTENKKLKVSIITPTLNRGEYLEQNILSVKNQDYPLLEHIVVDGKSVDNSLDVLKKYEGTYNMRWISERDSSNTNAMNKGFKMATGDIYCWLDSDDTYLPGTIKKVVNIFEKHPEIDVVFGDVFIVDKACNVINYIRHGKFNCENAIYEGMNVSAQAIFWRRNVYEKLNGMDEKYVICADYDFFIRMGLSGAKFYHLRDFLGTYRHHYGQLTGQIDRRQIETTSICNKYMDNKISPVRLRYKKIKSLFRKSFYLVLQGDAWFVARGFLRRIKILHNPSLD